MRILVTGGTGFVGSHTVAMLLEAGHEVRLLVRSPDRVRPALDPLGVAEDAVDVVTGNVTDPASIRAAMQDCDAVIHAGSVYSLDPRRASEIRRTNVTGTDHVISEAIDAGLDPIVHVSSIAAFYGRWGTLSPDTEPSVFPGAYLESKSESDRVARRYQESGAPVVITYPGSVFGPHDPHMGESAQVALEVLRGGLRFTIHGGLVVTDVRDLAALHAAVMEPRRGPRRYFAPGVRVELRSLVQRVSSITGRELKCTVVPTGVAMAQARISDFLQRWFSRRLSVTTETVQAVVALNRIDHWDASRTAEEFDIVGRDVNESIRDTLHWLAEQGHATPQQVGRLAPSVERADESLLG